VVGGGPAGLMAAEAALAAGVGVDLYESRGSVGRKFLIAGRGGLNLTHSESLPAFAARYGGRADAVAGWLRDFDNDAHRAWAAALGVDTFVGSSGRVFPTDMKAAPLLRAWLHRLRASGLRIHVRHRCLGWTEDGALRFDTPDGERCVHADATVLALGGASWPQLGSDGAWTEWLDAGAGAIAPLRPANAGFDLDWSAIFSARFAGTPVKRARLRAVDPAGDGEWRDGEFVVTATGIEGSLVYALAPRVRDALEAGLATRFELDLAPVRSEAAIAALIAAPRAGRSLSDVLRRRLGFDPVRIGLVNECVSPEARRDAARLASAIKALPLLPRRARPIAEAISSAGGVRLEALDAGLMLARRPGVFCAGEMLDWEAPTGGYLLAACFASGLRAGRAAARWLVQGAGLPDRGAL
jgi:uncharacterized flavoprotein (TIGR03862 family)